VTAASDSAKARAPRIDADTIASSIDSLRKNFEAHNYICSDQIATAVYLAFHLRKPVLIEGPPGVGKTELAKTTATMFDLPLIRLQCYEGLDEAKALYEWKYGKQLLYTQVLKETLDEVLQGAKGFKESVAARVRGHLFLRGIPRTEAAVEGAPGRTRLRAAARRSRQVGS
jgi:MoxR-like ATPase